MLNKILKGIDNIEKNEIVVAGIVRKAEVRYPAGV